MTTVETRVVDPVPSHSSVDVSQPDLVNVALTQDEEEKILEDEDIESCEGEDLEEQMLNVALMNSVVESGGQPVKAEENSPGARYGLRKRPRPSESLESGSADAIDPKPVAVAMPRATIRNGRLSLVLPNSMGEVHTLTRGSEMEMPKLKQESSGEILTGETRIDEGTRSRIQQSIAPKIQIKTEPQSPRSLMQAVEPQGSFSAPKIPNKVKKVVSPRQSVVRHTAAIPFQGASMNSVMNTSGAVPNPLSQSTPPTTVRPVKAKIKVESSSTHPSVPCPLPSSVPCPLQPQPPEEQVERRVTIVEPPVPITRNRIFSVDLDRKYLKNVWPLSDLTICFPDFPLLFHPPTSIYF